MTPEFRHLLITKFNIRTSGTNEASPMRLDKEWLRDRLAEFETFCAPSVEAQTTRDFSWLVLCDEESPSWFKAAMSSNGDLITPLFLGDVTNATLPALLKERGYVDRPGLITSRLDNDDAIARNLLETVQDLYVGQERLFVNFPLGVRAHGGYLYRGYW